MLFVITKTKTEIHNIPVQYQRFWQWEKRSNQTYRHVRPFTPQEKALPISTFLPLPLIWF